MEKGLIELPTREKLKSLREVWKNLKNKGFYEREIDNPMEYAEKDPEERITTPSKPEIFVQPAVKKSTLVQDLSDIITGRKREKDLEEQQRLK